MPNRSALSSERNGTAHTICLDGELDLTTADRVDRGLKAAEASDARSIVMRWSQDRDVADGNEAGSPGAPQQRCQAPTQTTAPAHDASRRHAEHGSRAARPVDTASRVQLPIDQAPLVSARVTATCCAMLMIIALG
jgi:hypothetical protein